LSEDLKCVAYGKFDVLISTKIGWLCEEYPYCHDGYVSILEDNVKLTIPELIKLVKED
jgi:hypothetical protein